jgi:dihydrodipicolinate synthase/N-acetylneuraminate lyase
MLEKILRRFVTEDTKVILAAIEKWGEKYSLDTARESALMVEDYLSTCSVKDLMVVKAVISRVDRARKLAERRKDSLDTAAKILMGEEFKLVSGMGQAIGGANIVLQQYATHQHAAQQGLQNAAQQGLMGQSNASAFGQRAYGQGNMISSIGMQR